MTSRSSTGRLRARGNALLGSYFFRRQRSYDFLETRIVPKRIPQRVKAKVTVGRASREFRQDFELLKSEVAFSGPSTNNGKATKDVRAIERVFRHRQELDGAATLAQGLLVSPQERIGQTEGSESWGVIRMRADLFFLLRTGGDERGACRGRISSHAGNQTRTEGTAQFN